MSLIAAPTFIGLEADAWSAIGVWVTIGISLLVAVIALRQVSEAQKMRHEQTRPVVIADIFFRDIIGFLRVRNLGTTPAYNLRIELAERVESLMKKIEWQESVLFTTGVPLAPPGFQLRYTFDRMPQRLESELPKVIRGKVHYGDALGREYHEDFVIDLTAFKHSLIPDKTMHELVRVTETVRDHLKIVADEMRSWSRSDEGIFVAPVRLPPDDGQDPLG